MTADLTDRIVANPDILGGKPCIKGTRISVELVLGLMASGWTVAEILENYPHLTPEDIKACFSFAHDLIAEDYTFFSAA